VKALVVLSGGLDSSVVLAQAVNNYDNVCCLSFWYGSKHNDREWMSAQQLAEYYNVSIVRMRLDFISDHFKSDLLLSGGDIPQGHYEDESMKRTVVPFRNGIMLSIAAGYAESIDADCILIGNHFGDHAIYPDCRIDFINPMVEAIKKGTEKNIELISPFCHLNKAQIIHIGMSLATPLHLTYSCYNGGHIHCGQCGTCFERKGAFRFADIEDPTNYIA